MTRVFVTGGAGVRDCIHATDLARVHVEAPCHPVMGGGGRGHPAPEVPRAVECASGRPVPARFAPAVAARAGRARTMIGWRPASEDLDRIAASALTWEGRAAATRGRQILQA